jgi:hypothetical protein
MQSTNYNLLNIGDIDVKLNDIIILSPKYIKEFNYIKLHGNIFRVAVFNGSMNRAGLCSVKNMEMLWVDKGENKRFKFKLQ